METDLENMDLEIDWSALLRIGRQYLWWLLLVPLLGLAGGVLGSSLQQPVWEARTQVLITRSSSVSQGVPDFTENVSTRELVSTYKAILSEDWVRQEVGRRLGVEVSRGAIKVTAPSSGFLLEIAVQDTDPERARQIADTVVQVLIEQHTRLQAQRYQAEEERLAAQIQQVQAKIQALQQQLGEASVPAAGEEKTPSAELQSELELYQQILLNLMDKKEAVRLQRLASTPSLLQVRPAQVSEKPVKPRTLLNAVLGFMVGGLLVVGWIYVREGLNPTLREEGDLEGVAPVLATVWEDEEADPSEGQGPYVMRAPRSLYAEHFRILRANLEFLGVEEPLRSILVTSVGPGDRKSTLAVNLAAIFAQGDKKVLLVDADFHRPRLHRFLGFSNRQGLSAYFRGALPAEKVWRQWRNTSVFLAPTGSLPPNPAELLGSQRMRQFLEAALAHFDSVIVDAPPLMMSDPYVLAPQVDGVLLAARLRATQRKALIREIERLREVPGARLLGVVLFADARLRALQGEYYSYSYAYEAYHKE